MKKYKWGSPYEWLEDKVQSWDVCELRTALLTLAMQTDGDEIQGLFQGDMEDDGYFDTEKHPCSLCGNPTQWEVGGTVAQWYLCSDCEGTEEAHRAGFSHDKTSGEITGGPRW